MKRGYGKKSKQVLQPTFFDSSPQPPELRRSPRLQKVLQERDGNAQKLADWPSLSPQKLCRAPAEHALSNLSSRQDQEPVKRRPKRRNAETEHLGVACLRGDERNQDAVAETENALAGAFGGLTISTPQRRPSIRLTSTICSRSRRERPASSSSSSSSSFPSSTTRPPRPAQKHQVQLDEVTAAHVEPLLASKNVSAEVESFAGWAAARSTQLSLVKVGEGSYGQVFRASDARTGSTAVVKLMPLNPARARAPRRWQDAFTSVPAAAAEVRLLERMQRVPGYVEFRGACVLQGSMPELFMAMWDDYKASGRTVESRNPRVRGAYPASQLWLMLELSDAGTNLEPERYLPPGLIKVPASGKYLEVARVWDIFWQTAHAVARAEVYCDFEHRDLHLGNICVQDTLDKLSRPSVKKSEGALPIDSTGMVVTIIDYTLSRANMSSDETIALDFQADEAILAGEGDLQYDVYRWMDEILGERGCMAYDPRTNIVWLWHLLVKLLEVTIATPAKSKAYQSERRMRGVLDGIKESIDPHRMDSWYANSAGDLLQHAFAQEWILPELT